MKRTKTKIEKLDFRRPPPPRPVVTKAIGEHVISLTTPGVSTDYCGQMLWTIGTLEGLGLSPAAIVDSVMMRVRRECEKAALDEW